MALAASEFFLIFSGKGGHLVYEFGAFRLDAAQLRLAARDDDREIRLQPRVLDTLLYFVTHAGELLRKETLMQALWPGVIVEENSLNQTVSALRKALGENPGEPRYIVTVPGRGYRFIADVSVAAGTPAKSIAVMPFANLTADASQDYLGDGMAEELIHVLARVPGLKVPSRTSSFAYKGRAIDIRRIARDLGVKHVLEGSVRSAGERLRITAQLIEADTGYHAWSATFDRGVRDLFALQDDVAARIVQALQLEAPVAFRSGPGTADVEVYQLFLQARLLLERASPQNHARGMELLRQAIARDGAFARAHSTLAMFQWFSFILGFASPATLRDVEASATRAAALDPSLPEAQVALGNAASARGEWVAAEEHFRRARALGCEPSDLMGYAGSVVESVGHLNRAMEVLLAASHAAPESPGILVNLAIACVLLGRDAEGLRYLQLSAWPRIGPVPDMLSITAMRAGRHADAAGPMIEALGEADRQHGGVEAVALVYAAAVNPGQRAAAIQALGSFVTQMRIERLSPLLRKRIPLWYVMLGRVDAAHAFVDSWLDDMARFGTIDSQWGWIWLPEMQPFRNDPRFQSLASRLGLPAYWERFGAPDLNNG
jgi:TolB-like protein